MPYIDQPYLEAMLTTAQVAALVPVAGDLTVIIAAAHAETETALRNGGYDSAVPSTVYADVAACPDAISLAAFGAFVELAYGRNALEIPQGFKAHIAKLEEIRNGKMDIPGVEKNVRRAVGGVSFTESSSSVTVAQGSRPQIFSRKAFDEGGY